MRRFGRRREYLELAEPLTRDRDSHCRWQATIIVGEFIKSTPARVWEVARQLATSRNADVRMAAATLLLEHLLEHHPAKMLPLFRAEVLRSALFARTVASCWNFGRGEARRQIRNLIERARRSN
jgi:hypothetical protein